MTVVLPDFRLVRPASVAEAMAARQGEGLARFMAGGTDMIPAVRRGLVAPATLIDVSGIPELWGVAIENDALRIGAAATLAEIGADPLVSQHMPGLAEAAAAVAGPTHRDWATVGGNLCLETRCIYYNQSEWWRGANDFCLKYKGTVCHVAPGGERCYAAFSGDLAPALLVAAASVEIAGPGGRRTIPLADLYREDGMAHLTIGADELLVAVRVPLSPALSSAYAKARVRGAIDFPLAGVAVAVARAGTTLKTLRVALTGTNSRPFLVAGTEDLAGRPLDAPALAKLDALVQKQASPMLTIAMSAQYRRRVAGALACRLVRRLMAAHD